MSDVSEHGLWTLADLAAYMRVTVCAARKIVARGQLPPRSVVRVGSRVRIRAAIVIAWLEKNAA